MYGLDRTLASTVPAVCGPSWVAAWHASPAQYDARLSRFMSMTPDRTRPARGLRNVTIRMIVPTHAGGSAVRVSLSNRYGRTPLRVGAVTVAFQDRGSAVVPETIRPITFHGQRTISVAAGREALSDPVEWGGASRRLAVSIYVMSADPAVTRHIDTRTTSFLSAGNTTNLPTNEPFKISTQSSFYLTAVDVLAERRTNAIVAVGDSITDGTGTTTDADKRWTDALQARLDRARPDRRMSVVNGAISGNYLLSDRPFFHGASALSRLDWDIAPIAGLTDVILHAGTNDIASQAPLRDAAAIVAGLRRFADEAHRHGLRVFVTTITPTTFGHHGSARAAVIRTNVNRWIRETGPNVFDGVFDFAAAVTDPANPAGLPPVYDAGDDLHLGDTGQARLADSVRINALTGSPCL